jgi:hypothetical protein
MMNVWVCHLHFNYDERLGVSLAFQSGAHGPCHLLASMLLVVHEM